ncbi:hypothetical protein HK099_002379, partial [Clydaea vesicula]
MKYQLIILSLLYCITRTIANNDNKLTTEEEKLSKKLFSQVDQVEGFFSTSGHTNNWAVLVCTSRFWFNYRHIANTLSIYRTVKRLGIPDSNIILMLADDVSCNPRNHFAASVYNYAGSNIDLYGDNVEVDYRGYDVTVENFIRVLTDRMDPKTPRSKRLKTDDRSNILVYMTGHGGEEFLKFQDNEEIGSFDLADAFAQMWEKRRYHEIFFMIDTCQAASMYKRIRSPNILSAASSLTGEPSYSHHVDRDIGVAVVDRFTHRNLQTLEKLGREEQATLKDLFDTYDPRDIASTPGIRTDLFKRRIDQTLVTDFFGGVQNVELTLEAYKLDEDVKNFKLETDSNTKKTNNNISNASTPPSSDTFTQELKFVDFKFRNRV